MILAIETSCDEVSGALVSEGFKVHKNVIYSSSQKANETGGVVPELAARSAGEMIEYMLTEVIHTQDWDTIKAIAVTTQPGLKGSLLTGIEAGKTLAWIQQKPFIPVHHVFGHMCANIIWSDPHKKRTLPKFPVLVLTVSGGHNDIYLWKNPMEYEKIGTTKDDAGGECFDKCARMLGLGYPGGPALSLLAEKGRSGVYPLPRPLIKRSDYDFSFSGLKTAVLYCINDLKASKKYTDQARADIACEIEHAIGEVLLSKLFSAQEHFGINELHITGGVSANQFLRTEFKKRCTQKQILFRIPEKIEYCTDNGAMIGGAGQILF